MRNEQRGPSRVPSRSFVRIDDANWSILRERGARRWVPGTQPVAVSRAHWNYYLDELTFRFNRRTAATAGNCFVAWCSRPLPSPRRCAYQKHGIRSVDLSNTLLHDPGGVTNDSTGPSAVSSQAPRLLEAPVPDVAQHHVIDHVNPHQHTGRRQPAGQLQVLWTWHGIARGMVVKNQDRSRIRQLC
jgi:hypothetical protein